MKKFIKWLGVNEKVAKIAVWLLIIMVSLIIINTALASLGFPNYQLTYNNLVNINVSKILNIIFSWIISFLNFYSIISLVFKVNKSKDMFKYAILYLVLAIMIQGLTNYVISQIFILGYILIFCFKYSDNNWKYIIYGIGALLVNTIAQYICYIYKIRLIDFSSINQATKTILSLDYFIIIGIIILVKEIYLKKRGEKQWEKHHVSYGLESSKKKEN